MNLDTECHLRINEVTDCGCLVTAMVRTDTAVPVRLKTHPVVEHPAPLLGVAGLPDFYPPAKLTHYAVDLRIGVKAAADVVPHNSSVELWVPVKTTDDGCAVPPPGYAYMLIRHLVDGVKAIPWEPCPEHEARPDRQAGDMIQLIGSAEPGIRPYWTFDQEGTS